MVQVQTQPGVSPQDYLAQERVAAEKSEYFNGQIYAMAGASPRHTLITADIYAKLEWPDPDTARGWLSAIKEPGEVYAVD